MLTRLWNDEGGAILSAELILIMTMLVIGLIVGLHAVQKAIVTELVDVAQAIGSLNQSYIYMGFQAGNGNQVSALTAGSQFTDARDLDDNVNDNGSVNQQTPGSIGQGVSVAGPTPELQ
jgi:hypothetical protein